MKNPTGSRLIQEGRRLKRILKSLVGLGVYETTDCSRSTERFGSGYGGWDVAVEHLSSDSIIYSCGVGEDITFDTSLIKRFGLTVHAFDPTPRSVAWIAGQSLPANFFFHRFGVAGLDGFAAFTPPKNPDHVSFSILEDSKKPISSIDLPVKRILTIMEELGHREIDVLKLDIEGAEYEVLDDLDRSSIRPSQILVEFHHRLRTDGLNKTRDAIAKLRRHGYCLFEVSSSGKEFSFVQSDQT